MTAETAAPENRRIFAAAALAVITGVVVALLDGNFVVALAPVLAIAVLAFAIRAPLGTLATSLLFVALLVDNVAENPGMGLFKTPLHAPGRILYAALEKTLHVPGLKLFGLEAAFLFITALLFLRGPSRREDRHPRPADALLRASTVAAGACLAWEVWGAVTGGNVRFSMLQFRPVLFLCLLPMLMAWCLREPRWIRGVLAACVVAAIVRNALGIFYWWAIIRHGVTGSTSLGGGTYVMTHSDSILAVTVLAATIVELYERPSPRAFALAAVVFPIVGLGVIVNNRRLAIVALVLSLGFIYVLADGRLRRRVHLTLTALAPLALAWLILGWNSGATWARPVRTIRSVLVKSDSSSQTRGVENYNLYVTYKHRPVTGWGFGHEYIEQVKMFDISAKFEAYLYVPHNSVLGLLGITGPVGFVLIFGLFVAIVFLAARTYRAPRAGPEDRVLALTTLAVVITFLIQAFGDMGMQSWMGALLVAAFGGLIANAATRTGAWPEGRR